MEVVSHAQLSYSLYSLQLLDKTLLLCIVIQGNAYAIRVRSGVNEWMHTIDSRAGSVGVWTGGQLSGRASFVCSPGSPGVYGTSVHIVTNTQRVWVETQLAAATLDYDPGGCALQCPVPRYALTGNSPAQAELSPSQIPALVPRSSE